MLKAVIFDMNGVIINDERFHQEGWKRYFRKHNIQLSEEEYKHNIIGRRARENLQYIHKRTLFPQEEEKAIHERIDYVIEMFKPHLKIMGGLDILLEELYKNHIPMAVATGAVKKYFDFIMNGLQIRNYFTVVIMAHDVTKGKPDPEIYLKTAEKLQLDPKDCVVFEDAIPGIKAAKGAGMKVVGVATTHTREELTLADKVVNNFNEINLTMLQSLW